MGTERQSPGLQRHVEEILPSLVYDSQCILFWSQQLQEMLVSDFTSYANFKSLAGKLSENSFGKWFTWCFPYLYATIMETLPEKVLTCNMREISTMLTSWLGLLLSQVLFFSLWANISLQGIWIQCARSIGVTSFGRSHEQAKSFILGT